MELRPGYKQTEAGVIPDDWSVSRLDALAETSSGTTPARALYERYYRNGLIAWVKTMDLRNSDVLDTSERVTDLALKETGLRVYPTGTVLVAMYGGFQQIGRTGLLRLPATVNQAITAIRPTSGKLVPEFLLATLNHRVADWKSVASSSRKDPNISSHDVRSFPIAYPAPAEQRAIAAALNDVDALVGGLDRLITKKRDLKQAAMQQLLTGQTRLPGFHGEWESGTLASVIGALETGVSVNSIEDNALDCFDGLFILKTSSVSAGRFMPRECKRIAMRDLSRAYLNPLKDTIIISRMNTPDLVGECGYVDRDYPNLFVPDRLWMTRLKPNVSARWLSHMLSSAALKRQIVASATGTSGSMKNLSKEAFMEIPIAVPSAPEQTAIAAALSDMDAELVALEARRDKTRALKQGMMQELLTGRTRLV